MNTVLEIFILVNVFAIGILTAVGIRHAYAHFRPQPDEKKNTSEPVVRISAEDKEKLLDQARANYQKVLERSANELQTDLSETALRLNGQLEHVGTDLVNAEMKRYQETLDELRTHTEAIIGTGKTEMLKHQADLEAKLTQRQAELETNMAQEIETKKQKLLSQIDTKLADAVASFLTETLQHNIDLGTQEVYLTAMLEEHKAELIKGMSDDA
jgi:hypothetical protein